MRTRPWGSFCAPTTGTEREEVTHRGEGSADPLPRQPSGRGSEPQDGGWLGVIDCILIRSYRSSANGSFTSCQWGIAILRGRTMARSKVQKPKDSRLPRSCDVCQSTDLSGPSSSTVAQGWTCNRCGAESDYYYRIDGELFDVPPSWGRCIGVVFEPESVDRIAPEDLVNPEIETHMVEGELYYIFQANDGTIRRARMGCSRFGGDHKRPITLPEKVKFFHYWNVDVWPPAQSAGTSGTSTL